MILFLCPECGRFGAIEAPLRIELIACPYCKNNDVDWMSRPDLVSTDNLLAELEKEALDVLRRAYITSDTPGKVPGIVPAVLQVMANKLKEI